MIIDLGKMSEYRLKISDFTQTGTVDPQFHVEGVPSTNHTSFQKTRLSDLSYGIKKSGQIFLLFCQCTRLPDRKTDG